MKNIKKSIITKHISSFKINRKIKKSYKPEAGDVAVFNVLEIRRHRALQDVNGNKCYIFPGDQILATFGNSCGTDQFEGYVPNDYQSVYHILGQGGAIGVLKSMHQKFDHIGPTKLRLVGFAVDEEDQVINTKYLDAAPIPFQAFKPRNYQIILSVGSSMDSGKTTSAAFLSRGLKKQLRKKVAFIKLTGTVFARDKNIVRDCGADIAIDFSTLGFPSTHLCSTPELLDLYESLLAQTDSINPEVVVVEIAGGLLQRETRNLFKSKRFMNTIDGVMLSCGDSMSVLKGVDFLQKTGHPPFLVSGLFTASPLLVEEVRTFCNIPVFSLEDFLEKEKLESCLPGSKQVHAA